MKRSASFVDSGVDSAFTTDSTPFKKMQTEQTRLQTRLQNVIDRETAVVYSETLLLARLKQQDERSKQQDERDRYLNQLNRELHERATFMRQEQHAAQMQFERNKYTTPTRWIQ